MRQRILEELKKIEHVHNVKIIEGKNGLFIAMPSRKTANGEYKDVAHPISPEFRNELQQKILDEFNAGHVVESGSADDDLADGN